MRWDTRRPGTVGHAPRHFAQARVVSRPWVQAPAAGPARARTPTFFLWKFTSSFMEAHLFNVFSRLKRKKSAMIAPLTTLHWGRPRSPRSRTPSPRHPLPGHLLSASPTPASVQHLPSPLLLAAGCKRRKNSRDSAKLRMPWAEGCPLKATLEP